MLYRGVGLYQCREFATTYDIVSLNLFLLITVIYDFIFEHDKGKIAISQRIVCKR